MDVTDIVDKFTLAHDYVQQNYHKTWDDCWKVYNNKRVMSGYQGTAEVFIPETFTIVESLVANIGGGKPRFEFLPTNKDQNEDTEIVNGMVDFYWDQNRMGLKTLHWIRDMIMYGNGIMMVTWENESINLKNIPLKDFYIDPSATTVENAHYMGYRRLVDIKDLESATMIDPDTGESVKRYKNINKIDTLTKKWDDLDRSEKEMFKGTTLGKKAHENQVEVVYMCTKDKIYEVANRTEIIFEADTPYRREEQEVERPVILEETGEVLEIEKINLPEIKPFFPFAALRNYADPSLFYAKGDVEVIIPSQEQANDIAAQKSDNITHVLNNMWTIDPQFADMASEIESLPGAVYALPRGALVPIEKPFVTRDADSEIFRILDTMRRATAADEVVQGASQQQGRVTATEVQAQINQANQRFSTKLEMLESEGYAQLGSIMFKMIQLFIDTETAVRVLGSRGVEWKDYDPAEHTGEYEPRVRLESRSKQIKQEEGQKLQAMYQVFAEDPAINQTELKDTILRKVFDLEDAEVKKLLTPQQPQGIPQGLPQGPPPFPELNPQAVI